MATILITGANRGIGLEFARQYAADSHRVIATVRDPAAATDVLQIAGDVSVHTLDMTDRSALAAFPDRLSEETIDIAVLNAGVGGKRVMSPDDGDHWLRMLSINSVAPTLLALALLPKLRAAKGRVVAMSSQMGSIGDNKGGADIDYRSSKAALNAAWRSIGIDWKAEPVALAVIHPGWVKTDMGGPNALITPTESIAGMRRVIDGLRPGTGCQFLDFRGNALPW